jgi:hypothetical protein
MKQEIKINTVPLICKIGFVRTIEYLILDILESTWSASFVYILLQLRSVYWCLRIVPIDVTGIYWLRHRWRFVSQTTHYSSR